MLHIQDFENAFGAYVIAAFASSTLLGLGFVQTYHYFNIYSDRPIIKSLVIAVMAFETIQVGCVIHAMYFYLIAHPPPTPDHLYPVWSLNMQFGLLGTVVLLVQLFYVRRIYIIGRKSLLAPAAIAVLALTHFIACWTLVAVLFQVKSVLVIPSIAFVLGKVILSASVAMDITVAATLSYYLHTSRTGLKSTDRLINRLTIYAINNGIIIACYELVTLALVALRPMDMKFLAFSAVLSSLYTISLLATLNTRKHKKVASDSCTRPTRIRFALAITNETNDPENHITVLPDASDTSIQNTENALTPTPSHDVV